MSRTRDEFVEDIERRLARLACDAIVDNQASDSDLDALIQEVEASGFDRSVELAAGLRQVPREAGGAAMAEIQARWAEWLDQRSAAPAAPPPASEPAPGDDVAADVAALQADPELASMFMAEALDHLGTIEATLLKIEESPGDEKLLNDLFRPFHTVKGNAGALGVQTVQKVAHTVENLLDLCRSGRHAVGPAEVEVVLSAVDLLTAMLGDIDARIAGREGRDLAPQRRALLAAVEAVIAGTARPRPVAVETGMPASSPAPAAPRAESGGADGPTQTAVKVDTRKLDSLVDTVGELVILQSLIHEDPALASTDERLTRNLAQLKRMTTDLQRTAMSMRMVPIRQTFQKMARLVRDLGKKSGKLVELTLSGEDTELDRRLIEDINDPLVHMIRNSLDHGIEPAAERERAGKRPQGRLSLSAYHQGGNIVLAITDDGAGLDTDRILKTAIARGVVAPDVPLSAAEIHQLIFQPGFSTAERVTEISGRGVGMDVVRRNVEALRGRIEIQTERGRGTTFLIKLPLTLAILEGLLMKVGRQRFVMPTFAIRGSLRPQASQVHTIQGQPRVIQVRNDLLPLVPLAEVFSVPDATPDPTRGTVIVIEDDARQVGLLVDELIGKQEVVVKTLGEAFRGVRGVAGGAILGDGRVGLILDAHGLVELMNGERARAA